MGKSSIRNRPCQPPIKIHTRLKVRRKPHAQTITYGLPLYINLRSLPDLTIIRQRYIVVALNLPPITALLADCIFGPRSAVLELQSLFARSA